MKKYARFFTLALVLAYILLPTYQTTVKAADDVLMTEKCEPEQSRFDFEFSTIEATGMIRSFDVSDDGRIATCISPSNINVYDEYGNFAFAIYTDLTRTRTILQWDNDTLLIYLDLSSVSGSSHDLVKVNGYEDYTLYTCPVNVDTEKFWNRLEQHENEVITDNGRYYVKTGNLRYTDNESGEDHTVTENTSFQPWWLLSIPILTAIIWFGGVRKRVKEWEKVHNNKIKNEDR